MKLKNTRTCYGCKALMMGQYSSTCLLGFKQENCQPKEKCFKPTNNNDFYSLREERNLLNNWGKSNT